MVRDLLVATIAAALWAGSARANDSAAAIGAGGIQLVQQGDVAMLSEDLYVSKPQIRVKYEFRNDGKAPVKTLVAFPMPPLNMADAQEHDIGWPSDNQDNPIKFKVVVDGKPVVPRLERKAFVGDLDVTAKLTAAGVPVMYPFGDFWNRLTKVKKADIDKLAKAGVVNVDGGEVRPQWTLKHTYFWDQTFAPGQIVTVAHEYAPIVGGSFWGGETFSTVERLNNDEYMRDFCIDQSTLSAIDRKIAALPSEDGQPTTMLSYLDIRYVLKTGRNWKGTIGKFKLTIDKGAAGNVVSFCADGVKKTGPTTFVVEKTNWEPDRDLAVLIVQAP